MLAGCATVPPPSMSVDEIASFKLAGVEIHGVEVIRSWPVEEKHFLATNTDPEIARRLPDESAQNFPAVQAFFQAALRARVLTAQFESLLAPVMRGTRPVKVIVTLKQFDVPSVVRRVLIDQYAKIELDPSISLTSKTNAHHSLVSGTLSATISAWWIERAHRFGTCRRFNDPGNTLIANYVLDYRSWLVTR